MKKLSCALALVALLSLSALSAALASTITVGASVAPHAEILAQAIEPLKRQGITLKIIEFTDYVTPNLSLNDGELDANFFQHLPYLQRFCADRGLTLSSVGSVHINPMALFSHRISDVKDIKKGSVVAIPSDPTNSGRALLLLQSLKLITLVPEAGLEATELDVDENPLELKFRPLEAAQLPRVLDDADIAVINGNYAIAAGLNPVKDSIAVEGSDSPYANVVVVRPGDEKRPEILALIAALQTPEIEAFIRDTYAGGVIAAFSK